MFNDGAHGEGRSPKPSTKYGTYPTTRDLLPKDLHYFLYQLLSLLPFLYPPAPFLLLLVLSLHHLVLFLCHGQRAAQEPQVLLTVHSEYHPYFMPIWET